MRLDYEHEEESTTFIPYKTPMGRREQAGDTNTHIPKPHPTSSSSRSAPHPASNLPSMSASSPLKKKDIKDTGSTVSSREKKKERDKEKEREREGRETHIRKPSVGSALKATISSEYKASMNRSTDSAYRVRIDRGKRAPESPARTPSMFRGRSVPASPNSYSSSPSSYSSSFSKVGPGGMRGGSMGYRLPSLSPSAGGTIAPPRPPSSRPLPTSHQLTPPESSSQSHSHSYSYSLDGVGSVSEGEGLDRGKALIRPVRSYESRTKELSDYLDVSLCSCPCLYSIHPCPCLHCIHP